MHHHTLKMNPRLQHTTLKLQSRLRLQKRRVSDEINGKATRDNGAGKIDSSKCIESQGFQVHVASPREETSCAWVVLGFTE